MFQYQLVTAHARRAYFGDKGKKQGRKEREKGGTMSRAPRSPNNIASTFFNTVDLVPKDLRFEREGDKLASCPRRQTAPTWGEIKIRGSAGATICKSVRY